MKKIKIRMLFKQLGSENGINVSLYKKGEEYSVNESLANVFLKNNVAEKVTLAEKVVKTVSEVIEPKEKEEKEIEPDYKKKVFNGKRKKK
jgi:hypothetical protein